MATNLKNLSEYDLKGLPDISDCKIAIVKAEWNSAITDKMKSGAVDTLVGLGISSENVLCIDVPGSFELIAACRAVADKTDVDAVIAIGCVIRGETPHFDYICQGVTYGLSELNLSYDIPFIFGVLTTENLTQAEDRSGGKHGNKGVEAAITAIKMIAVNKKLDIE